MRVNGANNHPVGTGYAGLMGQPKVNEHAMENASYVNLAHQLVLRSSIDILANNIANATTGAYKGERMIFSEYLVRQARDHEVNFVRNAGLHNDFRQGNLTVTGNPLDIALQGRGFFVVDTPDGARYSRAGHLRLNEQNTLVTGDGFPVLGDGGPIELPPGGESVVIARDGTIASDGTRVDKIRVVLFEKPGELYRTNFGFYNTDQAPITTENTQILQNTLEESNVQPIVEITRMIDVFRSYQSAQRASDTHHDLQRRAIQKILSTEA